MAAKSTNRVLGIGNYEARWVAKSLLVRLTATGILPCSNYEAQLEKRHERVYPPMWDMVFIVEDYCEKGLKPFSVEAVMTSSSDATKIIVRDAAGEHEVPILLSHEMTGTARVLESAADIDQYIVYAKLPKMDNAHYGCIVVPADTLVTGIHYRTFGPASKAECDAYTAKNCTKETLDLSELKLAGGEMPWPLLIEEQA